MTTGSFTARSGCKACGAQPSPTATTQPMWCEACGDCFTCGEPNAVATLVAHQCPGGTAAVHLSASQLSVADWPASSVRWLLSDILASGPISPGYQHSPATYVEGRETPPSRTDLLAAARESARNLACRNHGDDATRGDVARGVAAGYVTIIELVTEFALELSANVRPFAAAPSDPDAATVEACARAALDGYEGNDPPMYSSDWGQLPEDDRDAWREVARAVLAAAARGAK